MQEIYTDLHAAPENSERAGMPQIGDGSAGLFLLAGSLLSVVV